MDKDVVELNLERMKTELVAAVDAYRTSLRKRNEKRSEIANLENVMNRKEAFAIAKASNETNEAGVKLYKNEIEREAAKLRSLDLDESYRAAKNSRIEASKELADSEAELAVLDLKCKNYRSILDSEPREMQLITRG